jgi:Flp pilus assembly protein TadD
MSIAHALLCPRELRLPPLTIHTANGHTRRIFHVVIVTAVFLTSYGCGQPAEEAAPGADEETPASAFVGADACADCHSRQFADWQGSHHELAMQPANENTVLGDFSGTEFQHFGVASRFFRRDGKYWARTDNADGELEEFEVKYAFGVSPLQQYLVEFPDGRLQTLPITWDTRPREQGGQRWFHVYGDEMITHTDPLHWTEREQNWNYMCAECHSTGLEKNYAGSTDSFDTTWTEINVACEACHGPASRHIELAESGEVDSDAGFDVDLDDRGPAIWQMNPASGIAERTEPVSGVLAQPEACGRCHARRGVITPDYQFGRPLTDTHLPSLLDEYLYFPDGQIRDEVYVYGSFLQSRMYRAGVTCSDCHDPHTAGLKTTGKVSNVCATCHLAAKFASPEHHHHPESDVDCVDCHMPSRTYMVVDPRRDHSFRVPRPQLTVSTGSPNACTKCHSDEDTRWAADAVEAWYGTTAGKKVHFAEAIHAGRSGSPGANTQLVEVIKDDANPGIVRATALTLLAAPLANDAAQAIKDELSGSEPLIRIAALRALERIAPEYRAQWAASLLTDPIRAVRIQAARTLSPARATMGQTNRVRLSTAEAEYIEAQMSIAERPESHINLANLYMDSGDATKAEDALLHALHLEPRATAARVNLADLYRRLQRDSEAAGLLQHGITLDERDPALHHSLGLVMVRGEKPESALVEFARAVELEPENSRYVYVYAVALNSLGEPDQAIAVLDEAREAFPADYDIAWALATIYRDTGRNDDAKAVAGRLAIQFPEDQNIRLLLESL